MNVSTRTQFFQNFSTCFHTHPACFRVTQLACAALAFVGIIFTSEDKLVLRATVGLLGGALCSQIPLFIRSQPSPQQQSQQPPTEITPFIATNPPEREDSEGEQVIQRDPDASLGALSLSLPPRCPPRHAEDTAAGACHGDDPDRHEAAGDGFDFDFPGYSPCSSEVGWDLLGSLPPFRPDVFFAKGNAPAGTARSPLLREYRVRTEEEEIPRRLQTSLDRARIQMEGLLRSPLFRFEIPAPEVLPSQTIAIPDLRVGICSARGHRPGMEDAHIATAFTISIGGREFPCRLFGIFDGHGGSEASRFVASHIRQVLEEMIVATNQTELSTLGMYNALKLLGVRLSEEFVRKAPALNDTGTTLTIALTLNGFLWTANIGDSRIILSNAGTQEQLTEDQKPGDDYYRQHIIARGGIVRRSRTWDGREFGPQRMNGVLSTARAIGDGVIMPEYSLSSRAKVTFKRIDEIHPESFLILVCDGITDVASTEQIVEAIHANRTSNPEDLARGLSHSALGAGSTDNVSSLIIRLR